MDYKKIIKSRDLRFRILKGLEWIPDKAMVSVQYFIKMGEWPNLRNPRRFSEKIQWYKLYYRDPLMTTCVDKYEVYNYVKKKGYSDILIPVYGVWDKADDINFDALPERFVLKTTNSSHENIVIKDKSMINEIEIKNRLDSWLGLKNKNPAREWAYDGCKHRIICQQYIDKDKNGRLIDWRMQCFGGRFRLLRITIDSAESASRNELYSEGYYTRDFKKLDVTEEDGKPYDFIIEKPGNWDKMVEIAEKLSADFPQARIDLYNQDGQIWFGEITFYDNAGYIKFSPDKFDFSLGKQFILPTKKTR